MRDVLAIAVADSQNEKIGDCATTYAAQASCPSSCVFFNGGGCYAENGRIYSSTTVHLNDAAASVSATSLDVAKEEADAISHLPVLKCDGRPLRLHTVGDCRTDEAARIVAAAAAEYVRRGGGPVWTYSHAWRTVDRASWGAVSVLASCETPEQVELARSRSYATALVVEDFESRKLYTIGAADNRGTGSKVERVLAGSGAVLPCPAQTTEGVTCSSCRLCMDDTRLRKAGYSIGFAIHGTAFTVKKATLSLRAPSDGDRRLTSRDHAYAYLEEHGRWPRQSDLQRLAGVSQGSAKEMLERLRAERTHREAPRV